MAREYFLTNKIPFTEIDVVEDEDARKYLMRKLGIKPLQLPTIQIGETIISGWIPAKVKELL